MSSLVLVVLILILVLSVGCWVLSISIGWKGEIMHREWESANLRGADPWHVMVGIPDIAVSVPAGRG